MARLVVELSEDLKLKWQTQCLKNGITMSKGVVSWISSCVHTDDPALHGSDIDLHGSILALHGVQEAKKCVCFMCAFEWIPKKADPVACPACKSYQWNDEQSGIRRKEKQAVKILTMEKNDADRSARGIIKQSTADKRAAAAEQRELFDLWYKQFCRIMRENKYFKIDEVAERIGKGATAWKLELYKSKKAPVTLAMVEYMRTIKYSPPANIKIEPETDPFEDEDVPFE